MTDEFRERAEKAEDKIKLDAQNEQKTFKTNDKLLYELFDSCLSELLHFMGLRSSFCLALSYPFYLSNISLFCIKYAQISQNTKKTKTKTKTKQIFDINEFGVLDLSNYKSIKDKKEYLCAEYSVPLGLFHLSGFVTKKERKKERIEAIKASRKLEDDQKVNNDWNQEIKFRDFASWRDYYDRRRKNFNFEYFNGINYNLQKNDLDNIIIPKLLKNIDKYKNEKVLIDGYGIECNIHNYYERKHYCKGRDSVDVIYCFVINNEWKDAQTFHFKKTTTFHQEYDKRRKRRKSQTDDIN